MHPVKTVSVSCPFRYVSSRKPSPWDAGYHPGIDYRATKGTNVYAPADGKIIYAGSSGWGSAYGNQIIGESKGTDGKTYRWIIAHLSDIENWVSAGDKVTTGKFLGDSGSTGNTFGAHVHFEVRKAPFRYADHVNPRVITDVKGTAAPATIDRLDPAAYYVGAQGPHVTWLGERLVLHLKALGVASPYKSGPGPNFTETDRVAVAYFQRSQGWSGANADGLPGPSTLKLLAAAPPAAGEPPAVTTPDPLPFVILPRSIWTTTPDNRDTPLSTAAVTGFTIHYPADGDVKLAGLTQIQVAQRLEKYRQHHVGNKGWRDIGYNYAIDGSGRVYHLTGDDVGAHADTVGNTTTIGVLFVLGNNEQPTAVQIEAFKALRALKRRKFTKAIKVYGHQEVPGNQTSCPGAPLMAAIKAGVFTEPAAPIPTTPEPPVEPPAPPPVVTPPVVEEPEAQAPELPDFEPAPDLPEPVEKVRLRAACGNANVYWMGRWDARVNNVANVFQRAGASVVLCAEMYSGHAGGAFVREMGWGNAADQVDKHDNPRPTDSYDVHGGPHAGVKLLGAWDPDKRECLKIVDFNTTSNPVRRNSGTMAILLKDRLTGILSIWIPLHTEFEPKGPNTPKTHWGNKRRYDQVKAAMKKGRALANEWADDYKVDRIPVFVGGDMNGDLDDPFDGPGQAAKEMGFVDSDTAAEKRFGIPSGTHANKGGLKPGGRIDRWFVEKWVRVIEQETHDAYPHTDHNVVEIYVEFDNAA